MKKQLLFEIMLIVAGVCFCTNSQNNLQACVKETAACSIIIKEIKTEPKVFVEDVDDSFYNLINPINQL